MELREFNKVFRGFIVYYGIKGMTSEKIGIYYLGLRDLSIEQLRVAFSKMIKNRIEREFPMIAEIRKAALGIK